MRVPIRVVPERPAPEMQIAREAVSVRIGSVYKAVVFMISFKVG
jgi:hypothetical protein